MSADKVLFYVSRQLRKANGYADCIRIIPKSAAEAFQEIANIMRSRGLGVKDVDIWNDISNEAEPNLRASIFKVGMETFDFVRPD